MYEGVWTHSMEVRGTAQSWVLSCHLVDPGIRPAKNCLYQKTQEFIRSVLYWVLSCYGLEVNSFPQVHVSEHLVPSWWHCSGGLRNP